LPAAAVVLTRNNEILLVRRKFEPRSGDWTLPAGFVERDETAEQAAIREAKEETGLDIRLSGLLQVFGSCETTDSPIILIVYCGMIVGGHLQAGDDAEEARFFSLGHLPANIAFSNHRRAIEMFKMKETPCWNPVTPPLDRLTS
jgi:ADP-ribose pyrophosphatase YjhB (NUDIX family)